MRHHSESPRWRPGNVKTLVASMQNNPDTRVLIVLFDALRPEFVTPELMPNLHAFAADGVRYDNSHSIFPTETRVNQTAVVTGCLPRNTGIVANGFMAMDCMPEQVVHTANDELLERAFALTNNQLIGVPTLGQRLTAAGLCYASLSAGTAGGGRLINHSAEIDGSFRFTMRNPDASCPTGVLNQISQKTGPIPVYERPATEWISWAVDAYLRWIEPEVNPHLMLLWLCEPDETFHYHGIGSAPSIETIKHADSEFGRILESHHEAIDKGTLNIIAQSDHGQITLKGEPVDIPARLCEAGFRAAAQPADDIDCVVVVHNGGGIWVKDDDAGLIAKLVDFLTQQDWCGPLFTRNGCSGTLTLDQIGLDHPRAPSIALAMRYDDSKNQFGIKGNTRHDAPYPVGGGCHGGLSRHELHNFLCMGGAAFKTNFTPDVPAGNIDIAPTVCRLLGIDEPASFDGRVLEEALLTNEDKRIDDSLETTSGATNSSGSKTYLSFTDYCGVRYLHRAWVEDCPTTLS